MPGYIFHIPRQKPGFFWRNPGQVIDCKNSRTFPDEPDVRGIPCPGRRTSNSSVAIFLIDCVAWSIAGVNCRGGPSSFPWEKRNASPENNILKFGSWRQMLPGVCPGV